MTTLLARAFAEAAQLSDAEQNALAKRLLDEMQSEKRWSEAFAGSEDVLERLADEVIAAKRQRQSTRQKKCGQ